MMFPLHRVCALKACAIWAIVLCPVAVSSASAQDQARGLIAFADVNVISMGRQGVESGRTVVVQGDRIVAINQSRPPEGAVVVDGRGRFLLPGLTDSHAHLTTDMPWAPARADFADAPLYLAHGVTTVVNLRGTPAQLEWKRRIETGEIIGPTIYTSGEFVNEPRVDTPDEVHREVLSQVNQGYDLIKFHEIFTPGRGFTTTKGLSRESYLRMFETARGAGIPVVGHAPINLGLDGLLASSGGAVAHAGELVRLHFQPPFWTILVSLAAPAILLLIVMSWGLAWLVRRRHGAPATLTRAKRLTFCVLVMFLGFFVAGSMHGPGGLFYGRLSARIAVTLFFGMLVTAGFLLVAGSLTVWRDANVSARSRLPVLVAACVTILIVISGAFLLAATWKNTDAGIAKMAAQLRDAGVSVQTTLVVYETFDRRETATRVFGDSSFSSLMPETQNLWRRIAERPPGIEARLVPPKYSEYTRSLIGALHRNGVQLLAGTDAMGLPMVVPGSSLLRELHLLSLCGLTPYEAIQAATVNPAKFLGREKEFGTIDVGKRADLLLLESNPLENLAALHQPLGVMVRGKWLPRERLHELLSALR